MCNANSVEFPFQDTACHTEANLHTTFRESSREQGAHARARTAGHNEKAIED